MIKCVVCSQEVTSRRGLAFHLKKHGIESVNKYLEIYPDQIQYVDPIDDTLLTCPICGRYNMKQLGQHIVGTHKLTHAEFLEMYPNQKMFVDEISERCSRAQAVGVEQYYRNKERDPDKYAEIYKERSRKRLENNPDLGTKISAILRKNGVYDAWSERLKRQWKDPEYIKKKSEQCKRQHENGLTDIVLTKSYKNRSVHTVIGGVHYDMRSNWEVKFGNLLYSLGIPFEYETVKIPYFYNGKFRSYSPDFLISGTNIIFEIKPYRLTRYDINKAKQRWAIERGYSFRYITEYELKNTETINFMGCF